MNNNKEAIRAVDHLLYRFQRLVISDSYYAIWACVSEEEAITELVEQVQCSLPSIQEIYTIRKGHPHE